jgi:hypothetical protein
MEKKPVGKYGGKSGEMEIPCWQKEGTGRKARPFSGVCVVMIGT